MTDTQGQKDECEAVEASYLALLRMPHGMNRARIQAIFAGLRDQVAFQRGEFPEDVQNEFEARALSHPQEQGQGVTDAMVEVAAKAIFAHWKFKAHVTWAERGNSEKQDEARRYARAALSAVATTTPRDNT